MSDHIFKVGDIVKTRGGWTAKIEWTDSETILVRHDSRYNPEKSNYLLLHDRDGRFNDADGGPSDLLPPEPPKPVKVRRWLIMDERPWEYGYGSREEAEGRFCSRGMHIIEAVLMIPPDIPAQCDWLKDAEIVEDGE